MGEGTDPGPSAAADQALDRAATPQAMRARRQQLLRELRALRPRRVPSLMWHWTWGLWRSPKRVALEPPRQPAPGQVGITFAGHATVLVRYDGLDIVLDPMLGNWVGGVRRATAPGLDMGDLAEVGLILISHLHADHLHLPTLARLPRSATVVGPAGVAARLADLGFARVVELAPSTSFAMGAVTVQAHPIQHGDDASARGLAFALRGPGPSIFACAESAYFSGFAAIGRDAPPDLAILPVGGFWPASFRDRHMSPVDALAAFVDLRARVLIPVHYGAFALSYERLGEPVRLLTEAARARGLEAHIRVLAPGQSERFVLPDSP